MTYWDLKTMGTIWLMGTERPMGTIQSMGTTCPLDFYFWLEDFLTEGDSWPIFSVFWDCFVDGDFLGLGDCFALCNFLSLYTAWLMATI